MSSHRTQPPWEFLLTASRNTLHSYELSRLGHAANLRKEISSLLDQWLDENANAMVARWLIEQRERSVRDIPPEPEPAAPAPAPSNGHSVSDNFLTDRLVRPHPSRTRGSSRAGSHHRCYVIPTEGQRCLQAEVEGSRRGLYDYSRCSFLLTAICSLLSVIQKKAPRFLGAPRPISSLIRLSESPAIHRPASPAFALSGTPAS